MKTLLIASRMSAILRCPRNVSSRVCSTCEYSGFCLAGVRVDAANPPPGFRIGPANPELSAAPAE